MKRTKPLDPSMQFVVMDGDNRMSPLFYHEELGKATQREIAKTHPNATLATHDAPSQQGGFPQAITTFSQESRWLALRKPEFAALCEGWVTMATLSRPPSVSAVQAEQI